MEVRGNIDVPQRGVAGVIQTENFAKYITYGEGGGLTRKSGATVVH